jgi:hypothetical protein
MSHRANLISFWGIKPGSRVLEIGCGQGDTTVVLADAVDEHGFVDAIDKGSLDYGSFLLFPVISFYISFSSPSLASVKMFVERDFCNVVEEGRLINNRITINPRSSTSTHQILSPRIKNSLSLPNRSNRLSIHLHRSEI